jgi:predicted site-specific integrase-resolvase
MNADRAMFATYSPRWYSAVEVGNFYKVSDETVYTWEREGLIKSELLPHVRGRKYREDRVHALSQRLETFWF